MTRAERCRWGDRSIRAGNVGQTIGMIARVLGDMDRELHRGRTGR